MRFMNRASVLLAALLLISRQRGLLQAGRRRRARQKKQFAAAAGDHRSPTRVAVSPRRRPITSTASSATPSSTTWFTPTTWAAFLRNSPRTGRSPRTTASTPFTCADGVRFHDGRPFSAADVVFTLENLIAKSQGKYAEINYIEGNEDFLNKRTPRVSGLRVLDDHTVQIRLNAEFKFFLPFLAAEYAAIIPAGLRRQKRGGLSLAPDRHRALPSGAQRKPGQRLQELPGFQPGKEPGLFRGHGQSRRHRFLHDQHRHRRRRCRRLRPPVHLRQRDARAGRQARVQDSQFLPHHSQFPDPEPRARTIGCASSRSGS